MKRLTAVIDAGLALVFALSVGFGITVLPPSIGNDAAAEEHAEKKGGVRVDDLPKPIPSLMKTIQGVGNRVGKEISKATSKGAKAVKEAMKKGQSEEDQKTAH